MRTERVLCQKTIVFQAVLNIVVNSKLAIKSQRWSFVRKEVFPFRVVERLYPGHTVVQTELEVKFQVIFTS
jgi:hypothetical protein